MLLSPTEISEITGYSRPSAQIRWLKSHGWPFEIGASGRPVVLRAVAVARLGGTAENNGPTLRLPNAAA